jgi:hypothetical protein
MGLGIKKSDSSQNSSSRAEGFKNEYTRLETSSASRQEYKRPVIANELRGRKRRPQEEL